MEERNEDDENVRAVVVEHPKPRSRDQWSGYHLGPFTKIYLLLFPGRIHLGLCPTAKSSAGVGISKVCP